MMRALGGAMGTLAVVCLAAGQAGAQAPAAGGSDPQTLMAIERAWANAVMTHDPAPLEGFLADDFMATSETGEVRSKAETIAHVKASEAVFSSGGLEDMRVRVYGDAAVVTGRFVAEGRAGGRAFALRLRWTDTFIRRQGGWRSVASQSSAIGGK